MKLYALSDLHLEHALNREALDTFPAYPEDWLILAGDIAETEQYLHYALTRLCKRFAKVIWVPGNHDLWTLPGRTGEADLLRGEARYQRLVAICRAYGVLTPEDPYVLWPGEGAPARLVPLFLLYDYSFRPEEISEEQAVDWAAETDVVCTDEFLLHPDPYPSRAAWCRARCLLTEQRLRQLPATTPLILINHFPLHQDLVRLKYIPRFSLWCGTKQTENWHKRFPVSTLVYGHLHIPGTTYLDGVRCEEVSLGYPRQWAREKGMQSYLREILPGRPSSLQRSSFHLPQEFPTPQS